MDAGYMSFHREEDFSSYVLDPFSDESLCLDQASGGSIGSSVGHWDWDCERELNGDVGLIPLSSQAEELNPVLSTSPPSQGAFQRLMCDWQHVILEAPDPIIPLTSETQVEAEEATRLTPEHDLIPDGFDITEYIGEADDVESIKPRLGGKRIDMAKQRYVIDDEDTASDSDDDDDDDDVNTTLDSSFEVAEEQKPEVVTGGATVAVEEEEGDCEVDVEGFGDECDPQPVLQAGDLRSLLEQFEATECTNLELQQSKALLNETELKISEDPLYPTEHDPIPSISEFSNAPQKLLSPIKSPVKIQQHNLPLREKCGAQPVKESHIDTAESASCPQSSEILANEPVIKKEEESIGIEENETRVDIVDEIAVEVKVEAELTIQKSESPSKTMPDTVSQELLNRLRQCAKRKPVPVIPAIVPTKKRAVARNTIATNTAELPAQQVSGCKSVALDHDYCSPQKQARVEPREIPTPAPEEEARSILRNQPTVKNADGKLMVSLLKTNTLKKKLNLDEYKQRLKNRTRGNGFNSPAPEEDENARRLKHQEKLMQLAQDIIAQQNKVKSEPEANMESGPVLPVLKPPDNMVCITMVSTGTNTEESWGHLEQILQGNRYKITPNSLLSSIVEHLPKVKPVIKTESSHGEDKTIMYIDKDVKKTKAKTCSVHVQTITSGMDLIRRTGRANARRRRSSSSSCCSSASSSDSEDRSDSERSMTPSPIRRRHVEQMKEVEERRVIYVGRIEDGLTREELKRRFIRFGPITNVSVHYRRCADNYGFVTFLHKEDAYQAVELGNSNPAEAQYDLSFGGRRIFCQTTYADLDNVKDDSGYWSPITGTVISQQAGDSFDALLRQAQAKLRKRQQ